jgi:hypothetical protein
MSLFIYLYFSVQKMRPFAIVSAQIGRRIYMWLFDFEREGKGLQSSSLGKCPQVLVQEHVLDM